MHRPVILTKLLYSWGWGGKWLTICKISCLNCFLIRPILWVHYISCLWALCFIYCFILITFYFPTICIVQHRTFSCLSTSSTRCPFGCNLIVSLATVLFIVVLYCPLVADWMPFDFRLSSASTVRLGKWCMTSPRSPTEKRCYLL